MNFLAFLLSAIVLLVLSSVSKVKSEHKWYNFTVSYIQGAPDGVPVDILAVNGQFPGPEIRCTLGDTVHVTVTNQIKDRQRKTYPLSVHWHGLLQYGTIFADGPDHVTQCPILFGSSYEYEITPNQTGTYWWHSHTTWQYSEGMWGVFIVDNPNEPYADYYYKLNDFTITLNDWYHTSGKTNTDWYLSTQSGGRSPIPDSAMINGRGFFPCSVAAKKGLPCKTQTDRPTFEVRRNERYRFRIINTSALLVFQLYIEDHLGFFVIEVDGVDTVPVAVDTFTIAPGQRYSIMVMMNARPGAYGEETFLIHAKMIDTFNTQKPNINPYPDTIMRYTGTPVGILKYQSVWNNGDTVRSNLVTLKRVTRDATRKSWPTGGSPLDQLDYLIKNPKELRPGQQGAPEPNANKRTPEQDEAAANVTDFIIQPITSPIGFINQGSGRTVQRTNLLTPFRMLDEKDLQPFDQIPAPLHVSGDPEFRLTVKFIDDPVTGVPYTTFDGIRYTSSAKAKPTIFRMLQNKKIPKSFHPLKIDYKSVVQVVLTNPYDLAHPFHLHGHTFWVVAREKIGGPKVLFPMGVRRDTVVVEGRSSVYIRFVADNPGTWLFHCHINWHHQAGLAAVFVEAKQEAIEMYERIGIPQSALDLCRSAGITI